MSLSEVHVEAAVPAIEGDLLEFARAAIRLTRQDLNVLLGILRRIEEIELSHGSVVAESVVDRIMDIMAGRAAN